LEPKLAGDVFLVHLGFKSTNS